MPAKGRGNRHHQGKKPSVAVVILSTLLMFTVMLLILLGLGIFSIPIGYDDDEPFPIGEGIKSKRLAFERVGRKAEELDGRGKQWVEILSMWKPRVFLYHNFLSKEECEHLIKLAKPHMKKSKVVNSITGNSVDSMARTSSGTFLNRGQDEIVTRIEQRIADFAFLPAENGEALQILHYEVGQKYDAHCDYFIDEYNLRRGGQRIATVLMYLSDVEEGGHTVFPDFRGNLSFLSQTDNTIDCSKVRISVKPKMGNALLFWSLNPDASIDSSSLHGACPVVKGNKWSATKWLHLQKFIE